MTDETDIDDERPEPTPEDRADGPEIRGVPVTLGDGRQWLLRRPGLATQTSEILDRFYDQAVAASSVKTEDARTLAFLMLLANYRLSRAEAAALVWRAEPGELARGISEATWPEAQSTHRTWTEWARSALIANGIRPETVKPEDLPNVLEHLVQTKRAIPVKDFCRAHRYAEDRRKILAFAERD